LDFRLDEQQLALQDAVRSLCATRFPLDGVSLRESGPIDRAVWRAMGEMGVFGVMASEEDGGSGLGPVEAAIIVEQLGAYLAPAPALWSILTAPLLPKVSGGERIVSGLDTTVLDSDPILVDHAADLDTLVILRPDGVFAYDRGDLPRPVAVAPLDPLTPIGWYPSLGAGARIGGPADVARLQQLGTALTAAILVGVSAVALETARAFALERRQFGVAIGSFQAIKHMLADMYVRTSLARSSAFAAAALLQGADDNNGSDENNGNDESNGNVGSADTDTASAAAGAKLLAGEAAIGNGRAAVQVLGGMGFTWAMLPHYLLKRAWVLEHTFGTVDAHAAAIGSGIGTELG
jgi:alkylation response protein AidB-like acyl-CoA dehydrogenase